LSNEIRDVADEAREALCDDRMIVSEQHFRANATLLQEV
jgi:hypothetical protein